jgi:ribonuclease T1
MRRWWPWIALGLGLLVAWAAGARDERVPEPGAIELRQLPREARETLALIRAGGPFPYDKDGTVFGNRERLLPRQARGYYTEYTVRTPGSRDRGARRIVAGGDPRTSGEYWYTDDHYRSFRRIRE